jgi:hypothetical protein
MLTRLVLLLYVLGVLAFAPKQALALDFTVAPESGLTTSPALPYLSPPLRHGTTQDFTPRYRETRSNFEMRLVGPFGEKSRRAPDAAPRFAKVRSVPNGLERGDGIDARIQMRYRFW